MAAIENRRRARPRNKSTQTLSSTRTSTILCTIILGFALAGCATYRTPSPSTDLVTISGEQMGEPDLIGQHRDFICFTSVDDRETVSMWGRAAFRPYPTEIRVAPGPHKIGFQFISGRAHAPGEFWLDAYPGRSYKVGVTNEVGRIKCWVESRPSRP